MDSPEKRFRILQDPDILTDWQRRFEISGQTNPQEAWNRILEKEVSARDYTYMLALLDADLTDVHVPAELRLLFEKIYRAFIRKEYISDPELPKAPLLLFIGSTGSGKTATASRAVEEVVFGNKVMPEVDLGRKKEEVLAGHPVWKSIESVDPELAAEIAEKVEAAQAESGEAAEEEFGKPDFDVNGKPWDEETNPLVIPLMPDWVNDRINREIAESPQKGKEISENPDLIRDQFFEVLPATMFVLLPLVALLFKFWYLFANRYYVEHLIFALHNHSFIFVAALLMVVVNGLAAWIDPSVEGLPNKISELVNFVLVVWIPIYLLVSLRRVYGQGWSMTFAKYATIGISYLALLTAATAFAGALSFVLL
jgi:hypothetical protein